MKKIAIRKFSILGLALIGASAITAAVLPKREPRKVGPGALIATSSPTDAGQKTCVQQSGANQCTWTATDNIHSATTIYPYGSSVIETPDGELIHTDTAGAGKQSSMSPN